MNYVSGHGHLHEDLNGRVIFGVISAIILTLQLG
jgi:hypothetical protein